MSVIRFPSIEQYRNAIRNVKHKATFRGRDEAGESIFDGSAPIPSIKYRGTVKLHGTNAGIVRDYTTDNLFDVTYQSRERVLTLTSDNAGFMLYMSSKEQVISDFCFTILNHLPEGFEASGADVKKIAIFGEWCGQGIQKGVAISEVPKMFVIFGVKVVYGLDEEENAFWVDDGILSQLHSEEDRIFSILQFPSWELVIDFNHPEYAQQKMIEITEAVENECPVGKYFGVSGVGEGVVWTPMEDRWKSSDHWFKVKGEKHSVSKVKTLAPVDIEAVENLNQFVKNTVTEARLEQGIHWLTTEAQKPLEMSSMGDYIRWVFNDVMKEESDTIIANQLDPKKLGGPIANKARPWFINYLNSRDDIRLVA